MIKPVDMEAYEANRFNCPVHGVQQVCFVCQHLKDGEDLGFIEGAQGTLPDFPIREAWCIECDIVLVVEGDWTDKAWEHAMMKPVCELCFEEIKKKNI
jgi:hypothetical protein